MPITSCSSVSFPQIQTELVIELHVKPEQVSTSSPSVNTRPSSLDEPFTVQDLASSGKDSSYCFVVLIISVKMLVGIKIRQ